MLHAKSCCGWQCCSLSLASLPSSRCVPAQSCPPARPDWPFYSNLRTGVAGSRQDPAPMWYGDGRGWTHVLVNSKLTPWLTSSAFVPSSAFLSSCERHIDCCLELLVGCFGRHPRRGGFGVAACLSWHHVPSGRSCLLFRRNSRGFHAEQPTWRGW